MRILRRAETPAAPPLSDVDIRSAADEAQKKAEADIFAPTGPAYPGVGNGSTSGPIESSG